jgi:hypothetical protein
VLCHGGWGWEVQWRQRIEWFGYRLPYLQEGCELRNGRLDVLAAGGISIRNLSGEMEELLEVQELVEVHHFSVCRRL